MPSGRVKVKQSAEDGSPLPALLDAAAEPVAFVDGGIEAARDHCVAGAVQFIHHPLELVEEVVIRLARPGNDDGVGRQR